MWVTGIGWLDLCLRCSWTGTFHFNRMRQSVGSAAGDLASFSVCNCYRRLWRILYCQLLYLDHYAFKCFLLIWSQREYVSMNYMACNMIYLMHRLSVLDTLIHTIHPVESIGTLFSKVLWLWDNLTVIEVTGPLSLSMKYIVYINH